MNAEADLPEAPDDIYRLFQGAPSSTEFRALMNTRPSHLLDPAIFDFDGLALTGADNFTKTAAMEDGGS